MRAQRLAVALLLTLSFAQRAFADAPNTAAIEADALFREGRTRLSALDYNAACPLFAASFQREAATGTLLALAICHERQGDLNAALNDYREVLRRSEAESRPDRADAARVRIAALEAQLPPPEVVTAELDVVAEPKADNTVVEPAPDLHEPIVVAPSREAAPVTHTSEQHYGINAMQITGLALTGLGVFALGTAGAFTLQAIHKNNDSKDGCVVNRCDEVGRNDRLDARAAGTAATVSAIVGVALTAGGVLLYVFTGDDDAASSATRARATAVVPWVSDRDFGVAAHGVF